MNRRQIGAFAMLLLVSATAADTVDYYRMAESCWFVRMPAAQRPACCDFSAMDRFTEVGGDCCKSMRWESPDPAADTMPSAPVALAMVALTPPRFVPQWSSRRANPPPINARGPPYQFHPTQTTVLLL